MRKILDTHELIRRCQDAARYALRPPYGADDRAECVAHLLAHAIETVSIDVEVASVKRGRPADVIRYIDRIMVSEPTRQRQSMPLESDRRFTFTALANRAADWRRTTEAKRDHEALMSGADESDDAPEPAEYDEYLAAGERQGMARGAEAAAEACQKLGLPARVECGEYAILYQWARDTSPEGAAAELGITWGSYRVRTHRAAERVRGAYSLAEFAEAFIGQPTIYGATLTALGCDVPTMRIAGGEHIMPGTVIFALADNSTEAHGRTPAMAIDWRTGTANGGAPVRAENKATADALCTVRTMRAAPVASSKRRQRASNGRTPAEIKSHAWRNLGHALASASESSQWKVAPLKRRPGTAQVARRAITL